jgi:hypothetical protein
MVAEQIVHHEIGVEAAWFARGQDSLTEPKDNGCRDADSAEERVGAAVVAH